MGGAFIFIYQLTQYFQIHVMLLFVTRVQHAPPAPFDHTSQFDRLLH